MELNRYKDHFTERSALLYPQGNPDAAIDTRHLSLYTWMVIRSFRHRGLKRLWEGDSSRINAALRDRLENILSILDVADKPTDLDLPGYRLHPLKGDLKGLWSVAVSGNWRVTFRVELGDVFDVDLTDYH
jgi:proteic killer suppression protein